MDRRPRPLRDARGLLSVLIWSYVVVFAAVCAVVALLLVLLGAFLWDRDRRVFHALAAFWGAGIARTIPMDLELRGLENAQGGPFVITPTHSSVIDLLVVYLLRRQFRIVVKRSWFHTPYGLNIRLAGYIPTERSGDPRSAQRLIAQCRRWLRKDIDVLIFPEGTRSRDWKLRRFRRGPFVLAVNAGASVLPVAIAGSNDISHPAGLRFSLHKHLILEVLPPIAPDGCDSRELRAACRRVLEERMAALRQELRERHGHGPVERSAVELEPAETDVDA